MPDVPEARPAVPEGGAMTKHEAYERIDKGDLTWGHLKHYIEQCWDHDRFAMSAVNKTLTRGQSLDILSRSLDNKDDNELIVSPRNMDRRNALNSLIAVNVLRETHFRVDAVEAVRR
jgi:hypothetical protein